jgi:hypothetical protein
VYFCIYYYVLTVVVSRFYREGTSVALSVACADVDIGTRAICTLDFCTLVLTAATF